MKRYVRDRREGMGGRIYPWAPVLAKKAGFEEVTEEEAMAALGIKPESASESFTSKKKG